MSTLARGFSPSAAPFGTSRHPFRATLPLRVLQRLPSFEPEVQARVDQARRQAELAAIRSGARTAKPQPRWVQDTKDFLLAYTACLVAVVAYFG